MVSAKHWTVVRTSQHSRSAHQEPGRERDAQGGGADQGTGSCARVTQGSKLDTLRTVFHCAGFVMKVSSVLRWLSARQEDIQA
jgi:hypothetical protein